MTGQFIREFFSIFVIVLPFAVAMMCFRIVAPRLSLFADKVTGLVVTPRKYFREICILATAFLFFAIAIFFAVQHIPLLAEA